MSAASTRVTAGELLELKGEYLIPCVYHFYKEPPVIVEGRGVWLIDEKGKGYIDCYSGVTVMSAGHNHPKITAAVIDQMRRLQHTTTIYLTEPMYRLAERLAGIAPGGLKRTFFCTSGSEANETAMLLATLATGRGGFLALTDGLHGRTKWAMSATGLAMWRTDARPVEDVHFVPHAHCAHCPLDRAFPECAYACVEALEQTIEAEGAESIAALIAEPIQGNGGIVVPPEDYWQRVREVCDRHGILLIFDEIQTGMNRTGRWFACEHWNTVPDIVTMAKALGNGVPIAATIATDEVAAAYTRPGAATFGANPVSCAAALATLDVHEKNEFGARAAKLGADLRERLALASDGSDFLALPRGKGLMLGVDVVDREGNPDAERCDLYLEGLKDEGFLAGKTGRHRNTLTFMPPLIITEEQIALLADAVARVCV